MVISDLNYLETVSEATSIVGGRRRGRSSNRGSANAKRGNAIVLIQYASVESFVSVIGNNNTVTSSATATNTATITLNI